MNLETIVKLIDAGYTKDEIRQMTTEVASGELPLSDDISPKAPDSEGDTAIPPVSPDLSGSGSGNEELLKAIRQLTDTIQSGAIINSIFNSENERTADAIMASILRPDGTKIGGK